MESNKKMSIHLKVTDNETGKTLFDSDGQFLFGALCIDDEQAAGLVAGSCSTITSLSCLACIDTARERLCEQQPALEHLYGLYKLSGSNKTITELDLSALLERDN